MQMQKYFYILGSVVLTFYLLIIGQNLLIPLVLAIFLWYLINVFASAIEKIPIGRKHPPKSICYTIAVLTILGAVVLLVMIITKNITDVVAAAPIYQKNMDKLIAEGYQLFRIEQPPDSAQLFKKVDFGAFISQSALAITGLLGRGGLIIIYMLLLFVEQKALGKKLITLFADPGKRDEVAHIIDKIDIDIRAYIGIKSFVAFLAALCGFIILTLVGLNYAAFWAILIFILNFIPSIGSIIATALPSLLALLQFESHAPFFIVAGSVIFVQMFISNVIEPRLMSTSLNMSPLIIMVSLGLWGAMWGIIGMFLCIPIMVILMIIFSHFPKTRAFAVVFSQTGKIK